MTSSSITVVFALAAALTASTLAAQASFTNYGRGCALGGPPPLIRFTGLPQVGTTYTISQVALPNSITPVSIDLPILISGLNQVSLPVPVFSPAQPAGCNQLTTSDVFEIMPMTSPTGFATSTTWTLPNNPNLVGLQYNHQWVSLNSRCTGFCTAQLVRVSNAATAQVGL